MSALAAAQWQPGACAAQRRRQRRAALPPPLPHRTAALPPCRPLSASQRLQQHARGYACRRQLAARPAAAADAGASTSAGAAVDSVDDPATAFDWGIALALAGASFEAYNSLEDAQGEQQEGQKAAAGDSGSGGSASLKMRSMGGVEVSFLDSEFLASKFQGLMEVTVVGARGLPKADWWPGSSADAYAVVNIGDSSGATGVVKGSLDPAWGDRFYLFVSDLSSQRLSARVLDEDVASSDDLLGSGMRGLQDLEDGQERELELPLRGPKGAAGTLALRLRFLPFAGDGGELAGEAAAQRMGGPVTGSPPAGIVSSQWRDLLTSVLGGAADAMFDPAAFVENKDTDTQVWVFWDQPTRRLCVAFRGTEQVKWKDILTDLRLAPASLEAEGLAEGAWRRRPPPGAAAPASDPDTDVKWRVSVREGLKAFVSEQRGADGKGGKGQGGGGGEEGGEEAAPVWVHHGFLDAYMSVRAQLLRLLDTTLAGEEEPWTLYVTGHSLGGALATLFAYECARRSWRRGARPPAAAPNVVLYNYGSPRVGNRAFAEEFDALVPNAWRVANSNDAVTLVPRMMGYCHVGHKVELGEGGTVELLRNSSRALGEGAEMAQVAAAAMANLPALAAQVLDAVDGSSSEDEGAAATKAQAQQQLGGGGLALPSAAAVLAAAATALGGAAAAAGPAAEGEGAGSTVPAELQRLLEDEIEAMSCLMDGSALDSHLEPLYLENLRAAAEAARAKLQGGD